MQILLPDSIMQQLTAALRQAGRREIGGVLMGEHVAKNIYRIKSITVQYRNGTLFFFRRAVEGAWSALSRFFRATNYNYTKFNYLGEWHSHPSFPLEPSNTDCETMWEMIQDSELGANFAVLLIVHLGINNELDGAVTIYLPGRRRFRGKLIQERNKT